jgi:peptidyl-prolyl cis-trans isomerase SurA
MPRSLLILSVVSAALFASGCKRGVPDNVAASVNGRAVTYAELEKQYQAQFPSTASAPAANDDQTQSQRLEVLRNMIDSEIMLQRAEKLGLMATDADVDAKFAELKAPFTQEEFQKQLTSKKMSAEEYRAQIRRSLSVTKLFNKEISSHISITDKEVTDFYNANRATFNFPEPSVHFAQIVVTPSPDPSVHNLKNDKAQSDEQARQKIEMILNRARQGEDFGMLAQNYSEDSNSSPNGGDLGFIPESALEKVSPEIRKAVTSLPVGQMSPVLKTPDSYRLFKIISREAAGQRDLSDPRVQQTIRETLLNRKDQLLRNAYYEVARNEAKVTDYLALSITQNMGKK